MEYSNKLVDLIKDFEGFRPYPYLDSAGVWTIGYGTTRWNNYPIHKDTANISKDTAEQIMRKDLDSFKSELKSMVNYKQLNQNQFDALLSLIYNIGGSNFRSSTIRKKVNANPNDSSIRKEFLRWVYADGLRLKGLEKRREKEASLYFSNEKKKVVMFVVLIVVSLLYKVWK